MQPDNFRWLPKFIPNGFPSHFTVQLNGRNKNTKENHLRPEFVNKPFDDNS